MPDTNAAAPADDSIGGLVRAAFEKQSQESTPAPEAGAATSTAEAAPAEKVVEKPVAEAPADAKSDVKVDAATETQTPATDSKARTDRIPLGWKGGAAAWHAQSPEVKQYVADTIRNASQKIEQQAPAVKFASDIAGVFRPHEGFLRAQNANPVQAAQFLMDGYVTLRTGSAAQRVQILQNLAAEAGIDLGSIQAGETPKVDPELEALRREVTQLRNERTQEKQSAETATQASIASDLEAFASDPAHEHFETVRGQMAALLMSGQAKDLKDAYEKACWAHPDIRNSLVNKQLAQETEKRKKEAEKAKQAGASITGAPSTGSGNQSLGDMSLRQALEHQFASASRV